MSCRLWDADYLSSVIETESGQGVARASTVARRIRTRDGHVGPNRPSAGHDRHGERVRHQCGEVAGKPAGRPGSRGWQRHARELHGYSGGSEVRRQSAGDGRERGVR